MRPVAALLLAVSAVAVSAAAVSAAAMPNLVAVPEAAPYFSITLDAHAEREGAAQLLALLRERGVRTTIFFTGRFAERFPDLVRRAHLDGHELGNHTHTHPHLTTWAANRRHDLRAGVTRALVQDELRVAAQAIEQAAGAPLSRFWRAPYGEHNAVVRGWAAELGLQHVDWTRAPGDSLDALDWIEDPGQPNYLSAEAIARRLLGFERRTGVPLAGGIVLMHLGSSRPNPPLLEALPMLLDETDRLGLRPVPVGELVRRVESGAAATGQAAANR